MAKSVKDKDFFTYMKERDDFLKELKQFHQNRGTPYSCVPKIGGKEVDLYLLFRKVQELGGFTKVTEEFTWDEVQAVLNIPVACGNASQGLKNIYLRYVDLYQKVLSGQDPEQQRRDEFDDMSASSKRTKSTVARVPMVYRHNIHNVPDMLRLNSGMARNLIERDGQQKLEKALLSGLPNEVDFAINVATLLSNEGKHKLHLGRCRLIVDLFLAHVGVFRDGESLFQVYHNVWKPLTGRNFMRFWLDTVTEKEIKALLLPDSLSPEQADLKATLVDLCKDKSDEDVCMEELFNLGSDLGVHSVEGQRALQIATILRNLSFEAENKEILANDKLVLRFLLLCTYCDYSTLKQLALDTMGNLSSQLALDPIALPGSQLLMKTITKCIGSQDRFEIVRGLEIVSRLCLVASNQEYLSLNLEDRVYEDITTYLTVHDIQLIVFTLEAMYQLSKLGEVTATNFATCKSVIDILVSLITVEAQSYGPNSLQGIKVVEHVPASSVSSQGQPASNPGTPNKMAPPPVPQVTPRPIQPPQHLQPQRPVMVISASSLSPATLQSSSPAAPAAHAAPATTVRSHAELDAEVTARSWLTAHLEVGTGDFSRTDLYTEYASACTKHHLRCVQPVVFPKCIRFAFPKAEAYSADKNGVAELRYKGICKRKQPLAFPPVQGGVGLPQVPSSARVIVPPNVLMSPDRSSTANGGVIQTQLSSPTHNRQQSQQQQQPSPTSPTQNQHPILQQALIGSPAQEASQSTPTDTQMIKTLLAKKLALNNRPPGNNNTPAAAVASQPNNANLGPPVQIHGPPGPLNGGHKTAVTSTVEATGTTPTAQPAPAVAPVAPGNQGKPLVGLPPVAGLNAPGVATGNAAGIPGQSAAGHNAIMERLANKISGNTAEKPTTSGPSKDSCESVSPAVTQQPDSTGSKEQPSPSTDASSLSCQVTPSSTSSNVVHSSSDHVAVVSSSSSVAPSCVSSVSAKPLSNGPVEPEPSAVSENGASWTVSQRGNNCSSEKQSLPEKSNFVKVEESGSQPDAKSGIAKDLQHVNGNTNQADGTQQPEFKCKEMLSPEEIQQKKKMISHWLETKTAKDNAPVLNGVAKHIGNGDSHTKLNDIISRQEHLQEDKSKSNNSCTNKDQGDGKPIVENGYASPCEEPMQVDQVNCSNKSVSGVSPNESQSLEPTSQSSVIAAEQPVVDTTTGINTGSTTTTSQSSVVATPEKAVKSNDSVSQQGMPALPLPLQSEAQPSVAYVPPPAPASKGLGHMTVAGLLNRKPAQTWQQQQQQPASTNGPTSSDASSEGQSPSIPTPDQLQAQLRAAQAQPPPTTKALIMSHLQARLHSPVRFSNSNSSQPATVTTAAPSISHNPIMVAALKGPLIQMNANTETKTVTSATPIAASPAPTLPTGSENGTHAVAKPIIPSEPTSQPNQVAQPPVPVASPPPTPVAPVVVARKRQLTTKAQEFLAAKKKRTGSSDSSASSSGAPGELMCEWAGCSRCFESAKAVAGHVIQEHIVTITTEGLCKWNGCDNLLRKRYSLITHVQDRHMTEASLKAAAVKRQQSSGTPKNPSSTAAPATPTAPAPVYPDHAAYQAISRFAIRPPYPELLEMKEGPVTKHIRLTSALILRNLAKYSAIARSSIRRHERHLAYVALSAVESSTALSECLWELNHKQ